MLDKGKGLIIGKLRMIQLIEANLQLLMRIFLESRIEGFIEKNNRISKFNFGSRKFFSIEEAILEKRMIYKNSKWTGKQILHVIMDLAAYYDRQLANIESLVVESIGVERKMAKLIAKVIPAFKYNICTSYVISKLTYENKKDHHGGMG